MSRVALALLIFGTLSACSPHDAARTIALPTDPGSRDASADGPSVSSDAGALAAEVAAPLPFPSRARLVATSGSKALVRAAGFDKLKSAEIAYYAIVDTTSFCIESTLAVPKIDDARVAPVSTAEAATRLARLDRADAGKELAAMRALAVRFDRHAIDGLVFGDDGKVALAADTRGRVYRHDAGAFVLLPPFVRPPRPAPVPTSTSTPAPDSEPPADDDAVPTFHDDALTTTADGRVLFGYLESDTKECAAAYDITSKAVSRLVCVRARADGGTSFATSPRGAVFSLVERTARLNTLVVYRTPAPSPRPSPVVIRRTSTTNFYVVPTSYVSTALGDEGDAAWESPNDFGNFVERTRGSKVQWDRENASVVGVLPDRRVLVVPSSEMGSPTPAPQSLEKASCNAFRIGAFEDIARK